MIKHDFREHISLSLCVNAFGQCMGVRVCFKGVRNVGKSKLSHMKKGDLTGEWGISVSLKVKL